MIALRTAHPQPAIGPVPRTRHRRWPGGVAVWLVVSVVVWTAACAAPDPALQQALEQVKNRPTQARAGLRPFALAGDARAIAPICLAYATSMDSEVVEAERQQAFGWCLQASQAGHVEAQYQLGRFYQWGIGTPEDKAAALRWFQQAANRGHHGAEDAARGLQGLPAVCRNPITNCRMF